MSSLSQEEAEPLTSPSQFHAKWGPGKAEGRMLDLLLVLHVCEMRLCGVALELEEARRCERPSSGAISYE